jgi:thiamine-monophosphate kinase
MAQREFEIIQSHFKSSGLGFTKPGVDLGIGDDGALLSLSHGNQMVVSMDLLAQGVHFPHNAIPELIAKRALAVNISDLAAMGAEPLCFTLGLSLPDADTAWLEAFSQGLLDCALHYQCPLAGGDLVKGDLLLAIQVQGVVPQGQALLRSGAAPGDLIYVTGNLGDAAAALEVFKSYSSHDNSNDLEPVLITDKLSVKHRDYFINAFYQPTARIEAGIALRNIASSAIDVSDGLLSDFTHIAQASGVGAEIDVDQLPLSGPLIACIESAHRKRLALSGGDDYELCFTVAPGLCTQAEDALAGLNIPVTRIGEVVSGDKLSCLNSLGEPISVVAKGFDHFAQEPA